MMNEAKQLMTPLVGWVAAVFCCCYRLRFSPFAAAAAAVDAGSVL